MLNFGSNPDLESGRAVRIQIRTSDPDHILLGGRMRSLAALVQLRYAWEGRGEERAERRGQKGKWVNPV